MAEYIVRVDESRKATYHPKDPVAWLYSLPVLKEVVRCIDCANLAVGEDGVRWCSHWDKKVPLDGFCHLGEKREVI